MFLVLLPGVIAIQYWSLFKQQQQQQLPV